MEQTKKCSKCNTKKSFDNFLLSGSGHYCEECMYCQGIKYTKEIINGVARKVIIHNHLGKLVNCEGILILEGVDFLANYWVSATGKAYRWNGAKFIETGHINNHNYHILSASRRINGERVTKKIQTHILIATIFVYNPNPLLNTIVLHKKPVTKDLCDNSIENLLWGTHQDNMNDAKAIEKRMDSIKSNSMLMGDEPEYLEGEIWVDISSIIIKNPKGQQVSNKGRRRSKSHKLLHSITNSPTGYCQVVIGGQKSYMHILVATHFNQDGTPRNIINKINSKEYNVDHIDRNVTNNNATNLRIVPRQDNMRNRKDNIYVIPIDYHTGEELGKAKIAIEWEIELGIKHGRASDILSQNQLVKSTWAKLGEHKGKRITFIRVDN